MKIKFRAWDKYLKKMFHNVNPIFDDNGNLDFIIYEYENTGYNMIEIDVKKWDSAMLYHYERAIPVELMQYTGLKDSNGAEIYEGDEMHVSVSKYIDALAKARVVFYNGSFGVMGDLQGYGYDDGFYSLDTIIHRAGHSVTVCGNIYQNKELLEVE